MTLAANGFGINQRPESVRASGRLVGSPLASKRTHAVLSNRAQLRDQAACRALAAERTALISIKADEAQLVATACFFIVSDETKPQPTASIRTELQALARQGTPFDNDAAVRWPVLQTAIGQQWIGRCRKGEHQ